MAKTNVIKSDQQLAYWLQGFFEISGKTELDPAQTSSILMTVARMEKKGPLAHFVLDTIEAANGQVGPAISARLNKMFEHEIDPSYEGNQAHFNDVHGGGQGPKPVMRC